MGVCAQVVDLVPVLVGLLAGAAVVDVALILGAALIVRRRRAS